MSRVGVTPGRTIVDPKRNSTPCRSPETIWNSAVRSSKWYPIGCIVDSWCLCLFNAHVSHIQPPLRNALESAPDLTGMKTNSVEHRMHQLVFRPAIKIIRGRVMNDVLRGAKLWPLLWVSSTGAIRCRVHVFHT